MNYEDLIEKLREKDGCNCECLQAAGAIEALLAERDAAVEELRREEKPCHSCAYCKKDLNDYPCRHCCVMGGMDDNWEWRGPQKGENNDQAKL